MIKEYKVNLTEKQKDFMEWVVNGHNFPLYSFYTNPDESDGENVNPVFGHIIRHRPENKYRPEDNIKMDEWGTSNSEFTDKFEGIFKDFCHENNIQWSRILRSAINISTHQPKEGKYYIHRDHEFPHKNFLMYLNDFTGGETEFFDDDLKLIKTVHPQKFKAVVSDSELHSAGYCGPHEIKAVFVVTFN